MQKLGYILLLIFATVTIATNDTKAENDYWTEANPEKIEVKGERYILPTHHQTYQLDVEELKNTLSHAPMEFTPEAKNNPILIEIPFPDGTFHKFAMVESPVMAQRLADKYPSIKTYAGRSLSDGTANIRLDITPKGFHAMILRAGGSVFIDPFSSLDTENYLVYYKKDFVPSVEKNFECHVTGRKDYDFEDFKNSYAVGEELRTYRLAVAANVEYSNFHGGEVESVLAAIVTTINRVEGVYRTEVSVSLELVEENDQLIFLDSDSYTNNSPGQMIGANAGVLNSAIGSSSYDIGHVFSTGGGGLAGLGVVCSGSKAEGVTGTSTPIADPFDIDYVAHEIGHQFGANHTFNGSASACQGNRNPGTAYEPGSGTTIMAYAGICGSHNVQGNSDPYFHAASQDEIRIYTYGSGNSCPEKPETGNTPPEVDADQSDGFIIPISTPFELTGVAVDSDSADVITYCWEQWDKGPAGHPNSPISNAPLFRSFSPTTSPTRVFPQLEDILDDDQTKGEILPDYERGMTFKLTARDNNPMGGGYDSEIVVVSVKDDAGPFFITSQDETGIFWEVGESVMIEWEVGNTDQSPINCGEVDIYFSSDGGETFDLLLAENVANDGSQEVTIPNDPAYDTTNGRVKVKCSDNIFFDINNKTIFVTVPQVSITEVDPNTDAICPGDVFVVDLDLEIMDEENEFIQLATENLPEGWTATFNQINVEPPTTVTMTVTTNNDTPEGTSSFSVIGTGDVYVNPLVISKDLLPPPLSESDATQLTTPNNGTSLDVLNGITFAWMLQEATEIYTLEVATSPSFENIVATVEDLTATFHTSDFELTAGEVYYWRVLGANSCTETPVASDAFSFQTEVSGSFQEPVLHIEEFLILPNEQEKITSFYLEATDNNAPEDLVYTVLTVPSLGDLSNNYQPISVGSTFTQADINGEKIRYRHTDTGNATDDSFLFDLQDGEGSWLSNKQFDIIVNFNTGIEDLTTSAVSVYPNPATEQVNIGFELTKHQDVQVVFYNVAGQEIKRVAKTNLKAGQHQLQFNLGEQPVGIYLYEVQSEEFIQEGKFLIAR